MTEKAEKGKSKFLIFILLFLVIIIIGIGAAAYIGYQKIMGVTNVEAFLNIKTGVVETDTGKGWTKATDQMLLSVNDKVRTLEGQAFLVLFDSVIIDLDPNTEILIASLVKENLKVNVNSGKTWNKFTRLLGIGELEVKTPTAVATIRGTEFGININDSSSETIVAEGVVNLAAGGESIDLNQFEKAEVAAGGKPQKKPLSTEDKIRMKGKLHQTLAQMKALRKQIINRYKIMVDHASKIMNISNADIQRILNEIDQGTRNPRDLADKMPIQLPVMDQLIKLSDEIIKQQKLIDSLPF
jgi:hypothetical protein